MVLPEPSCVQAAGAPEWIWVSRYRSRLMETRLIIAYTLIALMIAMGILGGVILSKRRDKARRRNSG